jgi:hypothetical protein
MDRWRSRRSIYHIVCYLKFFKPIGQQARISRSDHILRILNDNKCFVCFNRRLTGRDSRVSHELIRTRPREGAARRFYVNIIESVYARNGITATTHDEAFIAIF